MTIQDLKDSNLLLLECISGSKAYGLDTEHSDTDIKGVFYLPKEHFYGLNYIAQVSNETNDIVYYELGRFVELLAKNNPNMLELLASSKECTLYEHPLMKELSMDIFLSRLCKDTFAGYAMTQVKKARGYNKKVVNPVEQARKSILDFCFIMKENGSIRLKDWLDEHGFFQQQCGLAVVPHTKGLFALYHDSKNIYQFKGVMSSAEANEVSVSSIPKQLSLTAYLFFNKESYSSYCREYREYWDWVEKRNEDRFRGNQKHGKDYDAKNMMHTIRLLEVALELLQTGILNNRRPNRDELLTIKSGVFEYEQLLQKAEELAKNIEKAFTETKLKPLPDTEAAELALVNMRKALYH